MPPDEPDDEEKLEELPDDIDTPFSLPDEPEVDIADANSPHLKRPLLDSTYPETDTNIELEELYDEGIAGAAEAEEPNAADTVIGYQKPAAKTDSSGPDGDNSSERV